MNRVGLIVAILATGLVPLSAQGRPPHPRPTPQPTETQATEARAISTETPLSIAGTVTLSLDRFLSLTHRKHPGGSPSSSGATAPVPFLFNQGQFQLSAQDKWVRVEGDLNLQVFASGWVDVPLLSQSLILEQARLDQATLMTHSSDDKTCALLTGVGSHRLHLVYYLRESRARGQDGGARSHRSGRWR